MKNDLIDIQYLPLGSKLKTELYSVFAKLSSMQGRIVENYESTNIAGKYEDMIFTIYKDKNDNRNVSIVFVGAYSQRIVFIKSENINEFLSKCTYYSEFDTSIGLLIETTGLKHMSRKFCKFQGETEDKNYTITLSENEKNKSYKYEMTLEQNGKKAQVECIWSHYQKFLKNEQPSQIIINNNENEFIKFTITNNNTYQSVIGEKTYEEIIKMAKAQGLSLNNSSARRYVAQGMFVGGAETEILNKYLQEEQFVQTKTEQRKQEQEDEIKIQQTRKEINININENPQEEENIFIELGNISRRHAIRKVDNREENIRIKQNRR